MAQIRTWFAADRHTSAGGSRPSRRRTRTARYAAPVAAVVAAVGLAACSGASPAPAPTATIHKNAPSGGLRTDSDPLTKRYAVLGTPRGVTWVSGTVGDERVPGPSTYWIDAVVVLAPSTAADLRSRGGDLSSRTVDVRPDLATVLPSGGLVGSDALDAALSPAGWRTTAGLATDGRTLVFTSVGQ